MKSFTQEFGRENLNIIECSLIDKKSVRKVLISLNVVDYFFIKTIDSWIRETVSQDLLIC